MPQPNYFTPGNVVNPSNDPIVNERLRGLLSEAALAIEDEYEQPGSLPNFGKGLLGGLLGLPADAMSLMAEVPARLPGPQRGFAKEAQGLLQPYTSDGLAERMGADPSRLSTQAGLIGAPDPKDAVDIPKGLLAMTLFHGTPHRFDKFSLDAIGTGEGAQAYGHGLYFAENPGVANSYRETLSGGTKQIWKIGGDEVDMAAMSPYQAHAVRAQAQPAMYGKGGKDKWLEGFEDRGVADDQIKELSRAWDEVSAKGGATLEEAPGSSGHLYEVDIPDETVDKMLDWDAPLSEQPESVRALIKKADEDELTGWVNWFNREEMAPQKWDELTERQQKVFARALEKDGVQLPRTLENKYSPSSAPEPTGEDFYKHYSEDPEEASQALNEAGIPGIRFFDGNSRSKGEGTRNIVVFNPDDIREVKRDGEQVYRANR